MLGIWWSAGWSPFSLAMTALAGLLGGYYWVWSRTRFVRLIDALPGPKTLPLLGNILELVKYTSDSNKISKLIQLTCLLFAFLIK
jgi:cytochrome P450 family 4